VVEKELPELEKPCFVATAQDQHRQLPAKHQANRVSDFARQAFRATVSNFSS
jgi:hypothetical protein